MKIVRYALLGPLATVLFLIGCLPRCGYLQLLAAWMLGEGAIG